MIKVDILEIHKNCFDFLLDYQSKNKGFYFAPRKYNFWGRRFFVNLI